MIVLDVVLPTLTGYSVREEIDGNAHTRNIPVIIVTGSDVDAKRPSAAWSRRSRSIHLTC